MKEGKDLDMKVIAVVVTYNRKDLLMECMEALQQQSSLLERILVVDNCSTDGTGILFSDGGIFDKPIIYYHKTDKNLGGAGGFHIGMKLAYRMGAEWIWIMDDDTIPAKDCLLGFEKANDTVDERVAFYASAVFGPRGEALNVPIISTKKSETGYLDWYRRLDRAMVSIESATFVSLLINADGIRKCGLPITDYFIWGDDYEYTLRLTNNYGKAYLCGNSVAMHKRAVCKKISIENETSSSRIPNYYYNYRNNLISVHEYKGGWKIVLKNILAWNWLCVRILTDQNQIYKLKKVKTIHKGIWGYLLGHYDKNQFINRFTYDMD